MKAKSFLSTLLSCTLVLSVFGSFSDKDVRADTEPGVIGLEISGLSDPVAGELLDRDVAIVATDEAGTVIDAVEDYSVKWTLYRYGKETRTDYGDVIVPEDKVLSPELWEDDTILEELRVSLFAEISVSLKDSYPIVYDEDTSDINIEVLYDDYDTSFGWVENSNEITVYDEFFDIEKLFPSYNPDDEKLISRIEISDLDAPEVGKAPDCEVTAVTKNVNGTTVDAIECCEVNWTIDVFSKETGDYCGCSDTSITAISKEFLEDRSNFYFYDDSYSYDEMTYTLNLQVVIDIKSIYSVVDKSSLYFSVNGSSADKEYYYLDDFPSNRDVCYYEFYDKLEELFEEPGGGNGGGGEDPVPTVISSIEVTELAAPEAGKTIDGDISIVAKTKDGTVVNAIDDISLQWTYDRFGKKTGEDLGGGIIPAGTVVSEEFFKDESIEEDLTINAFAGVTVSLKDGYELADADSMTFTFNGEKATTYEDLDGKAYGVDKFEKIEELFEDPALEFLNGANSEYVEGSGKDLVFRVSGKMEDCTGVEIDDALVDSANYALTSGSTIITFKPAYLSKLKLGTHTITVLYGSNKVSSKFKILPKADPNGDPNGGGNTPATGDSNKAVIYVALGLISVAGIVALNVPRKKKNADTH